MMGPCKIWSVCEYKIWLYLGEFKLNYTCLTQIKTYIVEQPFLSNLVYLVKFCHEMDGFGCALFCALSMKSIRSTVSDFMSSEGMSLCAYVWV